MLHTCGIQDETRRHRDRDPEQMWLVVKFNENRCRPDTERAQRGPEEEIDPEQGRNLLIRNRESLNGRGRKTSMGKQVIDARDYGNHRH